MTKELITITKIKYYQTDKKVTSVCENVEQGNTYTLLGECKLVQPS